MPRIYYQLDFDGEKINLGGLPNALRVLRETMSEAELYQSRVYEMSCGRPVQVWQGTQFLDSVKEMNYVYSD